MPPPFDSGLIAVFRPEIDEHSALLSGLRRRGEPVEVVERAAAPQAVSPSRLRLGGSMSVFTSRALGAIVAAAADGRDHLELDLDAVVFVGARACDTLAVASRELRARGGVVVLTGGRPSVRRTLHRFLAGVDGIHMADTRAASAVHRRDVGVTAAG